MRKAINYMKDRFLGKHLEFRVRLFNVLAMVGMAVSLAASIASPFVDGSSYNYIIYLAFFVLTVGILMYSSKTGNYQLCYLISIVVIFLFGFPLFFFTSGAYFGTMPHFFVFAMVFTVFMLEGRKAILTAALELLVYIGVCLWAYRWYVLDDYFLSNWFLMSACLFGFVVVGSALSAAIFIHFRFYNQQQRELETAREAAFAASEAKSRFLANMSHEIRTPIGIMLGMNEVILRETDSEQIRGYSQSIENAGQQLLILINNILDVSTIEKGKLEIAEDRYETAELISALSRAGENLARGRELRFATEVDANLPRNLTGDMSHIRQIVTNFLSNAVKYTEQGGVTLSFSALPLKSANKVTLQIAVIDTGIGIKAENIPHLFDTFTRGDMQGRYVEGSGLGLAIAKEYAERMGGRVFAESEPGRGSVFALELAQKVEDWEQIGHWEQSRLLRSDLPANSFTAPECDVLIVDDNSENLGLIKSLLFRTLMRADTAESGEKCLDMAAKHRYDVIFMDYMMPGMDGEEALRRLKELPGFDTPVIALTANVVAGVRERLLDAGFCQYISKPVRWHDLETALLGALPKERVTIGASLPMAQVPAEVKDELTRELSSWGVELDDGLRYVGGDISQYGRSAAIFIRNYNAAVGAVREFEGGNDWAGMRFRVHSLKGNARNLGANALGDTAAKLERLCVSRLHGRAESEERGQPGDVAYISAVLPTLYLEWERAKHGLAAFTEKLRGILPEQETEEQSAPELDEVLDMLQLNQYQSAMDALAALIENGGASDKVERLREIREKTDELKFREAERLLVALMESGAGGNGC